MTDNTTIYPIDQIKTDNISFYPTGLASIDELLGGGLVKGSTILFSGTTGAGKSTLVLQLAKFITKSSVKILYVSGEESKEQLRNRADRLGAVDRDLYIMENTQVENVIEAMDSIKPQIMIIDSVQMLYSSNIKGQIMSPSQTTMGLLTLAKKAKQDNITMIFIGHATKMGYIAGMQKMQHMVDALIFFSIDELDPTLRHLSVYKNRFGAIQPQADLVMSDLGLIDSKNCPDYNSIDNKLYKISYKLINKIISPHPSYRNRVPDAIKWLSLKTSVKKYEEGLYISRKMIIDTKASLGFFDNLFASVHLASLDWFMEQVEKSETGGLI